MANINIEALVQLLKDSMREFIGGQPVPDETIKSLAEKLSERLWGLDTEYEFKCPECGITDLCSVNDMAVCGGPYCSECDKDMELTCTTSE